MPKEILLNKQEVTEGARVIIQIYPESGTDLIVRQISNYYV